MIYLSTLPPSYTINHLNSKLEVGPLLSNKKKRRTVFKLITFNTGGMESAVEYIVNCSCLSKRAKYPDPYQFSFSGGRESLGQKRELFQSNEIRTSKYTIFTFLPKALMLQFKRLANVYFLIISILMSISIISPINPLTAWAPLIIVIGISMIRQGYEDYQRYASDQRLNHQEKTTVIRQGKDQIIEWSQVLVGDICYIESEEMFPADLILLSSANQGAVAYIQTASLDGEKNLKPRNAFPATASFNTHQSYLRFSGNFEGDTPNKDLHKFQAKINLPSSNTNVSISGDKQLLYRGTKLKNTKWIYGLVVYTGKNTKIILNSQSESIKMSQIQIKVNYVLGIILGIQVVLCLICAILYGIYRQRYQEQDVYIDWPGYSVPVDGFIQFLTYFVLLNTMIPISLVVSMQIVKMFQKYFIEKDQLMFSQYRNRYVTVQSASLNEELGQIQYVFSDKTGTLTMNVMEFKIAVIGSHLFGDLNLISNKEGDNRPRYKGFRDDILKKMLTNGSGDGGLYSEIVVRNREGDDQIVFKRKRELAQEYFLVLGLAHEVVTETNKKGQVIYQGPSPDQIALVDAAKSMEYQFIRANQSETFIKIRGREKKFQLLQSFPFTSDRKRMSIIIRDPRDNRIKMFTKGADSIIKSRLSAHQKLNLDNQLTQFSNIGLRTLLVAMRIISQKQYSNFLTAVERLPQARRQKEKQELINELQTNLYLIGATAVLDRLQDDVAETIRDMIRANIKVWMLTGDKMETAENIAKSCKLIQPNFEILRLKLQGKIPQRKDTIKLKQGMEGQLKNIVFGELKKLVEQADSLQNDGVQKALMVEGSDLTYVLIDDDCKKELANLAKTCEAVICCRLLPIQKAEVVQVVRQYLNKITLAIGDGANDVPMIKTAHIGIGLYGEEGMGAVQASDYALPQFRMLWRLLFVHGRWNYIRISEMILYFFYKNMLFTLPQFITAFFCGFSGQTIFDDIYITLYNLVFTAIPLLIRAIFEQDVNYVYKREQKDQQMEPQLTGKSLIQQQSYLPDRYGINKYFYRLFPKIYFIGQENCIFNYKNYFMWMFEGVVQAVLITFFCFYILGAQSLKGSGISSDFWLVGITIYSSIILVVTFKLATHTRFWSFCLFFSIVILSLGFYAAYTWISNFALSPTIHGTAEVGWTTVETYLVVLFTICLVLFIDGVIVFVDFRRGSYASKMREVIHNEQINNRYFYDEISLFITEGLTEQEKR